MASRGETFVGTRKILGWTPDDSADLSEGLVNQSKENLASYLTITETGGSYSLEWRDTDGDLCTVTSLRYIDGGLSGGTEIVKKPIPLPKGARAEFVTDEEKNDWLNVSLVGGFVDGEPGTIVLEAHPRSGEERRAGRKSRGWRRWLRRLIHRLDELLAEA